MDLTVRTVANYGVDDHSWLDSERDTRHGIPVTLDLTTFDASQYANGYIPSGTVLGLIGGTDPGTQTAGPYLDSVSDGRQTASLVLFGAVKVNAGSTKAAGTALRAGNIRPNRLPFQAGQAGGGFLDANGRADLAAAGFKFRTA